MEPFQPELNLTFSVFSVGENSSVLKIAVVLKALQNDSESLNMKTRKHQRYQTLSLSLFSRRQHFAKNEMQESCFMLEIIIALKRAFSWC